MKSLRVKKGKLKKAKTLRDKVMAAFMVTSMLSCTAVVTYYKVRLEPSYSPEYDRLVKAIERRDEGAVNRRESAREAEAMARAVTLLKKAGAQG